MAGKRSLIELALSAVVVVLAAWVFWQRDDIVDQMTVWRYQPSQEILALADATDMSKDGRWNFYVADPSLDDREAFNQHCTQGAERTVILGCYVAGKIYIYDVNDERLPYVEEVTAAHEMLHAAYERLGVRERERVNDMIDAAMKEINNQHISSLVELYRASEPDQLHNEMHSILGTEAVELPRELEDYYGKYFTDRQTVVGMSRQYQSVFSELQQQQERLSAELNRLSSQIDSASQSFNSEVASFEADVAEFNRRARSGGFDSESEYDSAYQALTARQSQLEADRRAINDLIEQYNKKREQLQALIIETKSLNDSIDSRTPAEVPEV